MKLIVSFFFLLISISSFAQDQKKDRIDTVFATTNKTTTLMFPADVIMVDIGSEDFGWIKSGNLVLVKCAVEGASATSILVQYGASNELFHGTVAYSGKLTNTIIKFKDKEIPQLPNTNRIRQDSLKSLEQDLALKRLNILLADNKIKYKTLARQDEKLLISLSNMMTDDQSVYLKIFFQNSSKLDYKIDFTEFVYRNPIDKGDLKGTHEKNNVYPTVSNKIDIISAKQSSFLGYCIPRFTLNRKGDLLITVREKSGGRIMELVIPFITITEADPITKDKI